MPNRRLITTNEVTRNAATIQCRYVPNFQHASQAKMQQRAAVSLCSNSIQFNSMCKIPLSEHSSTVKTKNNTRQWKKKKYKIRNCNDCHVPIILAILYRLSYILTFQPRARRPIVYRVCKRCAWWPRGRRRWWTRVTRVHVHLVSNMCFCFSFLITHIFI